jgi:PKD repeat protein
MKRSTYLTIGIFVGTLILSSCERNIERYCFTVSNRSPKASERTTFNASCSEGLDLYHWNFGDGHDTVTKTQTVNHAFDFPGTYQVTLHTTHPQVANGCDPNPAANSGATQSVTVVP